MPKRRRLALGVFEDRWGISVLYQAGGKTIETRFPLGSAVPRLEKWRTNKIAQAKTLVPVEPRNSLARDVVRYLKRLKGLAGYKSEKSHLRAWLAALPKKTRHRITTEQVELAIAQWRQDGYAARTIRHRCRALQSLYRRLDGRKADTPLDDVQLPRKPKPRPVSVADRVIADVALQLRKHEMDGIGRLRDAKTRARFLVLATTGRRPAEVKRAQRSDVDLHRRLWFTRTAKGGVNTAIILNDEMSAAWQLFIGAQAWGEYDDRSFAKTLRRNGWPAAIRPYALRHSTARAIRARGGDLQDVQDQLGHASITTAREFYLTELPERQAAISLRLGGRFPPEAFVPEKASQSPTRADAKGRDFTRKSEGAVHTSGRLPRSRKSKKTA